MAVQVKSGTRLRSAVDETEVIVVRAKAGELDLRCGGRPMVSGTAPMDGTPGDQTPLPGYDEPTLLGKRYSDDAELVELLCTKGGPCTLSIGDKPLSVKGPRPLPASD